jgi:hypothetical protein
VKGLSLTIPTGYALSLRPLDVDVPAIALPPGFSCQVGNSLPCPDHPWTCADTSRELRVSVDNTRHVCHKLE